MPPNIGIHIPAAFPDRPPDAGRYKDFFQATEDLGFHSLWTEDRIFHASNFLESTTLMTWAAAVTESIQIGTAVMVMALRNAPLLARQLSTLDHLSGGRIHLGISIGGSPAEYRGMGSPMNRRVSLLRENISVLRQLLTGEPTTRPGRFYDLQEAIIRPSTLNPDGIPIYMGGQADDALRRAGELTEGWIQSPFAAPDDFKKSWALVRQGAERAGKNPNNLESGKLIYAAVDDDAKSAYDAMSGFLRGYYGDRADVRAMSALGTPDDVTRELKHFADAGVQTFMLGVPNLNIKHLERIATEVVPDLTE
ncbi:MAG: LLM class flavin-dependent oxidoreductase [SAR202 cluster bacterium]|nr:LLM class flavin-dependent oxidoreductase [SAR202 cluster bacterium]MDP6513412.1 LLM class flavin-dependent oxidoreductase [SAR202 cluster bacterium]MDP6713263.1 LLM class flavin-dependent oxidoreductase [SAR202 cluster bacterium]